MVAFYRRWFSLVSNIRVRAWFRHEQWVQPWNEITRQVEASLLALPAGPRATVLEGPKTVPALAAPLSAAEAVIEGEAVEVAWPPQDPVPPDHFPDEVPDVAATAVPTTRKRKRGKGRRRAA